MQEFTKVSFYFEEGIASSAFCGVSSILKQAPSLVS
jgi:hypothetical protein